MKGATGDQIKAARAITGLGVREVAAMAKMSPNTITSAEKGKANHATMVMLRLVMEAQGIEFFDNGSVRRRVEERFTADVIPRDAG